MVAKGVTLVGLTGSIGMGKSETAKMFARLGIAVYDADAAVHALYEKGGGAVAAIGDAFPGSVKNGRVERGVLAAQLTDDASAFKKLEAIVHPLVARAQRDFIEAAENAGAELVVLDVPLLFETGGHTRVDAVVVVSAPPKVQRARVLTREGMNEARLDQILARQMPDAEKRAQAHFVIETGKGRAHAFQQVQNIVAELKRRRAEHNDA
jgi:dephospho-CoA kinase